MGYLDRYRAGEHEQVWAELVALGASVRDEPLYSNALAVAHETMRRARHNIEVLIPRLRELGYRFGYEGIWQGEGEYDPPVFTPPAPGVDAIIAAAERRCGALPLSLRAFYEVVGSVNFVGTPPERWGFQGDDRYTLDPLYVHGAYAARDGAPAWEDVYGGTTDDEWDLQSLDEEDPCDGCAYHALPHGCFLVPIAPDECFKYGFSGCGNYEIAIPNVAADARLLTESHRTTFVNYLRICFRWGGLPGFERTPTPHPPLPDLAYLTEGLLPL
ncbi:MAG TPA: hypothetical protein VF116_04885 [Ktedonobacterales bacterium]